MGEVRAKKDQTERMLKDSIPRLIAYLSIPAVISNLISNIYNLVDTYFVGTLGVSASGATGIVFTLMAILQAVAFMLGHGAGTNISRRLAERDVKESSQYASVSFFLTLITGSFFLLFGLLFLTPLMRLLGSTETILPYARDYATYILIAAPAIMASLVLNNIFRYEGKTYLGMIGLSFGAVLNMIADPIFIHRFGMGIFGAGLATALSQYVSLILLIVLFRFHSSCRLSVRNFIDGFHFLPRILRNGFPSLIRQGLNSLSTGILNNCARAFGDACISAVSIVSRIQGFMVSICLGIGQGFQPVAGFNYQVKNYLRLYRAFRFTLLISLGIFVAISGFGILFSDGLVSLFIRSQEVIDIGSFALKITCIGLLFLPFSTCANMLFQSTGQSVKASFLACFRGGLCFIPIVLLFTHLFGMRGIQIATGVGDICAGLLSVPFFAIYFHRLPKRDFYAENAAKNS